ncbi:MAG: YebC/PmpR family DNA-binding transcriptional regulator [Myxococcales bacterium]|nr:MAG: YebC/PmpR family DNA-binding transcriptional regulator [Myxococcales bacterium]
MSGHNKWSSIKHKKGAVDAKRGKIFTKLIKEISLAAREGGGNPTGNPRLRTAIAAAKAASMPADNIDRAIKKGTGELEGGTIDEYAFEGYGPGGAAIFIEIATDNKNRTTADIRHILSKNNGNLGESGCVAWMFDRRGIIELEGEGLNEDAIMEAALELDGFQDMEMGDDMATLYTEPNKLHVVREAMAGKGWTIGEAKIGFVPQNMVKLEGKKAEQMVRLLEMLEENDDVQNVYTNADLSEAQA